jgi:hypothetical protein
MPFGMSNVPEMLQNQIYRQLIFPYSLMLYIQPSAELTVFQACLYNCLLDNTALQFFIYFLDNMCLCMLITKIVTNVMLFTQEPYNEQIHIQFHIEESFLWSL